VGVCFFTVVGVGVIIRRRLGSERRRRVFPSYAGGGALPLSEGRRSHTGTRAARRAAPEMSGKAQQTTVARPVSVEGIGLHSGERCGARLLPAEVDSGVVFAIGSAVEVPGRAEFVVGTDRGTVLGAGGLRVGCVEHVMAALYGMGVDNVRVEVEGPELPALDGSAAEWVKALRRARRRRLGAARGGGRLDRPVWASDGDAWVVAVPASGGLSLAVVVDFEGTAAGRQTLWLKLTRRSFARELAPARTFATKEEVEALRAAGLARGGGPENAFAVGRDGYSGPLRFGDEVVRHKALDLVGDVALCGRQLSGQVIAVRPGHRVNVAMARAVGRAFGECRAQEHEARSD